MPNVKTVHNFFKRRGRPIPYLHDLVAPNGAHPRRDRANPNIQGLMGLEAQPFVIAAV